jgi:hypothetical protein
MGIAVLSVFLKERACVEKRKALPAFVWETLFLMLSST